MIKTLILGSSGLLGRKIYETLLFNKKIKVVHTGLKKRKINFKNKAFLKKFINSVKPNIIINCIAYKNIDSCEQNSYLSKDINYNIIKEIFKIKKQNKLKFNFIHFSTDQLYNKPGYKGSGERSRILLINNYCKHKRKAEVLCLKNKSLIFRTNFFGRSKVKKNISYSDWIYDKFKQNKGLYLFNDVYFNPLRIQTIAKIIRYLIEKRYYTSWGIYNLGAINGIFKNEFALLFAKKTKVLNNNYTNIEVNKLLKTKRSTNMLMNTKKFEKKFKFRLPKIRDEILSEAKNYF